MTAHRAPACIPAPPAAEAASGGEERRAGGADCAASAASAQITTLAERLRAVRTAAGMSRRELARRARVDEGTLRAVEAGGRKPRTITLARVARALGVPPPWLRFGGDLPRGRLPLGDDEHELLDALHQVPGARRACARRVAVAALQALAEED